MNRAQVVQTIAACDALAAALREALKADAAAEYAEQGTAPTWRLPGFTVSTSIAHDAVVVVDEAEWIRWVKRDHPSEVETITRVRPAFRDAFFAELAEQGRMNPPHTTDGEVVPGLEFYAGGEFRSVSVLPLASMKRALYTIAREIADGTRPLGLPVLEAADAP